MLAFNFANRTFAYRKLAQGFGRALSALSSFLRKYLVKVIKADQFAHYVDDLGIAANDANHLLKFPLSHIWVHLKCRIEMNNAQMPFLGNWIKFLGQNNHLWRSETTEGKDNYLFRKNEIPKIRKFPTKIPGLPELPQELHPKIVWETSPILSTFQKGQKGPGDHRASTAIQRNQQRPWQVLPNTFITASTEQTTSLKDRC